MESADAKGGMQGDEGNEHGVPAFAAKGNGARRPLIVWLIIMSCCLASLYYYFTMDSRNISNRILSLVGNRKVVVCKFSDFTGFTWKKLDVSRGILGDMIMDFTDDANGRRTVSLSKSNFLVMEDYVTLSPVGQAITPDSFALLSNTRHVAYSPTDRILIQLVDRNEYLFIHNSLMSIESKKTVKALSLTKFKWDLLRITHYKNQYCYGFEFSINGNDLNLDFVLPENAIFIDDKIINHRKGLIYPSDPLYFSKDTGLIMMSAK
jgi:hypothetical protein